jgi:hypothetical protein
MKRRGGTPVSTAPRNLGNGQAQASIPMRRRRRPWRKLCNSFGLEKRAFELIFQELFLIILKLKRYPKKLIRSNARAYVLVSTKFPMDSRVGKPS